ncbi:MAG: STAS domain-containing protein [Nannocystis sp.]|nr:STAS domain-containing protein [Nannocystis sp.]MBA3546612.1 STAS domain-containing protein [Nannocystis sp.]
MADYPPLSDLTLASTLDAIPQMCFVYRDDGLLMAFNSHCERMLGVPRAAVVGTFNIFEHPEMVFGELLARYHDAFRGAPQVVPATEIRIKGATHSGVEVQTEVYWVETILVPLARRDDGTATYVLGIQRDVTELMGVRREIEAARQTIDVQADTIDSLEAARREIEAQKATIQALSTPVIEVWDGIITLPLLGHFNSERASAMTSQLLDAVVRTRARYAILDLTGLAVIDTTTGDQILRIVSAVGLLGATGVLVGIQAEIAQMFVGLGVDLGRVRVHHNLREALKACMREATTPERSPSR